MAVVNFAENDTGSTIRVTVLDYNDDAFDVTNYTVTLIWKNTVTGTSYSKTMTKSDATNGVCTYQFGTSELMEGDNDAEIKLTSTVDSTIIKSKDSFTIRVRPQIGA